jgi:hypothetical protein
MDGVWGGVGDKQEERETDIGEINGVGEARRRVTALLWSNGTLLFLWP